MKKFISTVVCIALVMLSGCSSEVETVTRMCEQYSTDGDEFVTCLIIETNKDTYCVTAETYSKYDVGDEFVFTPSRGDAKEPEIGGW